MFFDAFGGSLLQLVGHDGDGVDRVRGESIGSTDNGDEKENAHVSSRSMQKKKPLAGT